MKIYLTRHSKTLWNQEKRLQGRLDSPLTQEGIENAQALKKYLHDSHLKFDYIYTSPILRAYHTASLLFDENKLIQDERLMEMNFGDFEGRKIADIHLTDHESYDDVIARVNSFLNDLTKLPSQSQVLIVTHGMYFIIMLAVMLHLERKDFIRINQKVVEGCSLTCVEYDGQDYHVLSYNQHDYLPHVMNASFAK